MARKKKSARATPATKEDVSKAVEAAGDRLLRSQPGQHRAGPDASEAFYEALEPTSRELAEAEYMLTLGGPELELPVKVPLLVGGLNIKSTVVSLAARTTFKANANGNAWCVVRAHFASFQDYTSGGSGPGESGDYPDKYACVPYAPGAWPATAIAWWSLKDTTPDTTPTFNDPCESSTTGALRFPSPGVELVDAQARPVSYDMVVRPIGDVLTTKGEGMIFRPGLLNSDATFTQTFQTLYAQQAAERHVIPCASVLENGDMWRDVWLPEDPSNLQFSQTTAPLFVDGSYYNDRVGPGCLVFYASGCAPNQQFSLEVHVNVECRSPTYPFSTPSTMTDAGLAMVADMKQVLKPAVVKQPEAVNNAVVAMANSLVASKGPSKAKTIMAKITGVGSRLISFFKDNGPTIAKVGGAVASMVASAVVPALIGGMKGRASTKNPLLAGPYKAFASRALFHQSAVHPLPLRTSTLFANTHRDAVSMFKKLTGPAPLTPSKLDSVECATPSAPCRHGRLSTAGVAAVCLTCGEIAVADRLVSKNPI